MLKCFLILRFNILKKLTWPIELDLGPISSARYSTQSYDFFFPKMEANFVIKIELIDQSFI